MTNLADVTPFFDGVWVASPSQGEGEGEGLLHGNRCVESTPHLSPLPVVLGGEAELPGQLRRQSRERANQLWANTRFPVGSVDNPNGPA